MGSLVLIQNTFKSAHSIFIKIDLSVLMYILLSYAWFIKAFEYKNAPQGIKFLSNIWPDKNQEENTQH